MALSAVEAFHVSQFCARFKPGRKEWSTVKWGRAGLRYLHRLIVSGTLSERALARSGTPALKLAAYRGWPFPLVDAEVDAVIQQADKDIYDAYWKRCNANYWDGLAENPVKVGRAFSSIAEELSRKEQSE